MNVLWCLEAANSFVLVDSDETEEEDPPPQRRALRHPPIPHPDKLPDATQNLPSPTTVKRANSNHFSVFLMTLNIIFFHIIFLKKNNVEIW